MSMRARLGALLGAGLMASGVLGVGSAAAAQTCGMHVKIVFDLNRNLVDCPGDGLIVDDDYTLIHLNGHTISGRGTGTGIDFNGHRNVRVTGNQGGADWPIGGASDQAVISDFATGVSMDGRQNLLHTVTIEFTTGNGLVVKGDAQNTLYVTVSNAGGNGIDKPLADTQANFDKVKVFGSIGDGMHLADDGSSTYVTNSVFKQNDEDGIRIEPLGEGKQGARIFDVRANYNERWGINGARGVKTKRVTAVGNRQTRQCWIVECN